MKYFLVTGTGTGVGKTYTTVGIGRALARKAIPFAVFKPFETGISEGSSDALLIKNSLGLTESLATISPVRLAHALAPLVAAKIESVEIDIASILDHIGAHSSGKEICIVEGAGGIAVPILLTYDFLDLARDLGASCIIVAPDRLGVINNTLVTYDYIASKGVDVAGIVLNGLTEEADESSDTNLDTIRMIIEDCTVKILSIPYSASRYDGTTLDLFGGLIGI